MNKTIVSLLIGVAFAASAQARGPLTPNEQATARHYASLIQGNDPKLAELTLFFTQFPKGGDLHHHYSGAVYAEQYVEWIDKNNWCVNKASYRIETKAPYEGCLSGSAVFADNAMYRELLQRWSSKDFYNHSSLQSPPDKQFFDTFGYFGAVSNTNFDLGLQEIKKRALAENLVYIETMFKATPMQPDAEFDQAVLKPGLSDAELDKLFAAQMAKLEQNASFNSAIADYVSKLEGYHKGIDDANFTMRYQTYSVRLLPPGLVFSCMLSGMKAASSTPLIVGVNIVGAENDTVSMRDYSLHMKMLRFLKARYPKVNLAMHAGELALGMVPPEGLKFHIDEALHVAGAQRIGHGMDLAHESNVLGILRAMKAKGIPVEINLTSNDFILGIKGEAHPLTLYRKYGVPYVISTDDAGVSRNNLSNEYVRFASTYKPSYAEVKAASYRSIQYAFLNDAEKQRLTRQLDQRFTSFEAMVAKLGSK
ncbi:adenosine deaminase [Massilia sp. TS11]|uniref:adenosine deaminase n=1 Tax=Massilia sp. TS11 TaxID=2908003 RepID=UPI001EDB9C99|nr:adenosine deaminase [Massilia sp. TS11]MCG2586097.1 adenosine deaminase [Massilia sp. TS11]